MRRQPSTPKFNLVLVLVLLLSPATALLGIDIEVNSTADDPTPGDGLCSLREAIANANLDSADSADCAAGSGADHIEVPTGTYLLTAGELSVSEDLTLAGRATSGTVIDGGDASRLLNIAADTVVTIEDLTLTRGKAPVGAFEQAGEPGGAILNAGDLTLLRSRVEDSAAGRGGPGKNGATYEGGAGGGIYSSGSLTLIGPRCSISGNSAGNATTNPTPGGTISAGGAGGGIYNDGDLTLIDCVIRANVAGAGSSDFFSVFGPGGDGGGIANSAAASASIVRSLLADNDGGESLFSAGGNGGGIVGGHVVLRNCTVSGNASGLGSPRGDGGGLFIDGGSWTIDSSTVAGNAAGVGGGVALVAGSLAAKHTLLAGNRQLGGTRGESGPDCFTDAGLTVDSHGYNLLENSTGCSLASVANPATDVLDLDPQLEMLADNGGATETHALAVSSPAREAGEPGPCTDIAGLPVDRDQRGAARPAPVDGRCDLGAFEAGALGALFADGFETGNTDSWSASNS